MRRVSRRIVAYRPFASADLVSRAIAAVAQTGAAIPTLAVSDTVKTVDGSGRVTATLARNELRTVQTPQAFRAAALRDAHRDAGDASDDAALVEACDGIVVVVPGDEINRKITTRADLVVAEALLRVREEMS